MAGYRVERRSDCIGFVLVKDDSKPKPRCKAAVIGSVAGGVLGLFVIFLASRDSSLGALGMVVFVTVFLGVPIFLLGVLARVIDSIFVRASAADRKQALFDVAIGPCPLWAYLLVFIPWTNYRDINAGNLEFWIVGIGLSLTLVYAVYRLRNKLFGPWGEEVNSASTTSGEGSKPINTEQ